MIGQFPLWMVLVVWVLQRRARSRVTMVSIKEYQRRQAAFDALRGSLPIPATRLETWLTVRILTWLDRELNTLLFLQRLGLLATVEVSKN